MNIVAKDLVRRGEETSNHNVQSATIWWQLPTLHSSNVNYLTSIDDEGYVGWSIPHYHRKVRQGLLMPHTPWNQWKITGSSNGEYDLYLTGGQHTWSPGNVSSYQDWVITKEQMAAYVPLTYNKYVQEAAAKIYSSGFDALTFVAELADVRRMFTDLAKKLVSVKLPRNWKQLSSDWLSYRYGWRTLFYDMSSLNKAIANLNNKRTRFSERVGASMSETHTNVNYSSRTEGTQQRVTVDEVKVSLRGSVTADIDIPSFQFNPFVTAWEVIPFSFVLDWFVSVGKSIAAASFATLNHKYAASAGCLIELNRSMEATLSTPSSSWVSGGLVQSASGQGTYEVRTPCSVPLTPHFTFNIDSLKVLDLVGLVVQRFRR